MEKRTGIIGVAMNSVFLLWHVHKIEDVDSKKLIGAYETEEHAKTAIQRIAKKPGFISTPDGFQYERYEMNRDHWTEGFVVD